jgi:hypothetical protein
MPEVFCPRSRIQGVLAKRAKSGAVRDVEAAGKLWTGIGEDGERKIVSGDCNQLEILIFTISAVCCN